MSKADPDNPFTDSSIPEAAGRFHARYSAGLVRHESLVEKFEGPLPSPELLRQYELIRVGIADEFIQQFKAEASHRRELENKALDSDIEERRALLALAQQGQWIGAGRLAAVIRSAVSSGAKPPNLKGESTEHRP